MPPESPSEGLDPAAHLVLALQAEPGRACWKATLVLINRLSEADPPVRPVPVGTVLANPVYAA